MSLSKNAIHPNDSNLGTACKATTLNPHAAEFIPFSLRSTPSVSTSNPDPATRVTSSSSLGKSAVNRTESSISNNSDDEAHQFWHHQLPDDITPDFKVLGEDDTQSLRGLPLADLSLHDDNEAARFSASAASGYVLNELEEISPRAVNGNNFIKNIRFSDSAFGEDTSAASFMQMLSKPWDKQIGNSDQLLGPMELSPYNGSFRHGIRNEVLGEHGMVDGNETNPMDFLASVFPGFATDSLAEVYCANRCDMNMTIEMLTELELQIDGAFNPNLNSKTVSAPNLSAMDFPALSAQESQNGLQKYAGDDLPQNGSSYRPNNDKHQLLIFKSSSAVPSRGPIDFASAVKKLPARDSGIWKYDKNGSSNPTIGSSRSSQVLASAYSSGNGRSIYTERSQNRAPSRAAPVWLETGDAVANLYSELREEARDHARVRNAYFEQARQAYLVGNKALAKELSVKGQYHSMHMKASHAKAQESIFRQRNPVSAEMQGPERMIDLHGLHVTEAIHILKQELAVLRTAARSTNQRLHVYICVGTGHHTRGSRTPARLPVSIQRYLLEEEGLEFTEPQPGLLRVVIY